MREGEKIKGAVPSFDDGSVLTIKYLHELEDSVKTRTPLAGRGISITRTDEGANISLVNGATAQYLKYNALSVNVCSNGVPVEIGFVTKTEDNPYSGIFMVPSVVTIPTGVYDQDQPLSYLQIDTTRK
jgi:hypothetical protein